MIIQKGFANYFLIVQDIALKTKSTISLYWFEPWACATIPTVPIRKNPKLQKIMENKLP